MTLSHACLSIPQFLPLALVLSLSSCSVISETGERPTPPSEIAATESFAVYFSDPWQDTLTTFDLVVLDPDNRSEAEIQRLRQQDVLPIAYINLGEAESYRYFYDQVDPDWILGENPNWPEHYYIDARAEGWRTLLLETVIPDIMEKGFGGLFFDMVDTALPGLYPKSRPGMIALIKDIRRAYPDRTMIMNNGLFLVDDVHAHIDALIVENVYTRYDFDNDRYIRTAFSERMDLVHSMNGGLERYGLRSFLINYAGSSESSDRTYALQQSEQEGFLTFVSTVELDIIFPPPSL